MKVRGTQPHNPEGIHVDIDTVYVRSDAIFMETEEFTGWEYEEKQYRKDDYIKLISEKNDQAEQAIAELTLLMMGGVTNV